MKKVFEIAYQNENSKDPDYCLLRFSEVGAYNIKEAKEIFFRYHDNKYRIVQCRFKRKYR